MMDPVLPFSLSSKRLPKSVSGLLLNVFSLEKLGSKIFLDLSLTHDNSSKMQQTKLKGAKPQERISKLA